MYFPGQIKLGQATAYSGDGSGKGWANPANAIDNDTATYSHVNNLGSGASSEVLYVSGFDFSWIDPANFDVTSVTIYVSNSNTAAGSFDVWLVDENGSDLGSVLNVPTSSALATTQISQTITIPSSTYLSSNFGVKIRFTNNSGSTVTPRIYELELILHTQRKQAMSTGYGLKFYDAVGSEKLTDAATIVRRTNSKYKEGGYTGTFTFNDFTDTQGFLYFASQLEKIDGGVQQPKSATWTTTMSISGHGMELPDVEFDNTTKVVTISNGTTYPLPSGFEVYGDKSCGFGLMGIHCR